MSELSNLSRPLAALIAALVYGFAINSASADPAPTPHGQAAMTCTNPSSGASWRITIDYDHGTVDGDPASFTETKISWREASTGWRYSLDRQSGNLTVVLASATGGNFLYDHCKFEN